MNLIITSILPQYGEVNRIYNTILSNKDLSFEKHKFISDFYMQHKNTQIFESMLIDMVLHTDATHLSILFQSLKLEIESNISIYKANESQLNNIDIEFICHEHADRFNYSIENQLKTTREYGKEVTVINNSLESMAYRKHDQHEKELLNRKYEQRKQEYEKEKAKLNNLYDKKEKAIQEVLRYLRNIFKDICELSESLLAIDRKSVV